MTVAAIVQARMTSTRLPGKVMADLGDGPMLGHMLGHMLARLLRSKEISAVCVATSTNKADDPIANFARSLNVTVVRGDEQDVLGRFVDAAHGIDAQTVIRLTADCPMTDPMIIDNMVREFNAGTCDYLSNVIVRDFPDGLDVEVFSRDLLERAASQANEAYDREHVTTFMRRLGADPDSGVEMEHYRGAADFSHLRWTVDTPADLDNIRQLIAACPEGYTWLEALAALTRQPDLLSSMTAGPRIAA